MPASIVIVRNMVTLGGLNASLTWGGAISDDRRVSAEIDEAIFEAEDQINLAILETRDHWARPDYLAEVAVTHGSEVSARVGTIEEVVIQKASGESFVKGIRLDAEMINRYRANTGTAPFNVYGSTAHTTAESPLSGYWDIDGDGVAWFSGFAAKARILDYVRSTAVLQCPSIFTNLVAAGALAALFLKEGDSPEAADRYQKRFENGLAMIRGNIPAQKLEERMQLAA